MSENLLMDTAYQAKATKSRTYTIVNTPIISKEEILIQNLYEFLINRKTIYIDDKQVVGVSFPHSFFNELQAFDRIEQFLNQHKLFLIDQIKNDKSLIERFPHLLENNKRSEYFPITSGLKNFFNKNEKRIIEAWVQQSILSFLSFNSLESKNELALIFFQEDDIESLVDNFRKLYKSPFLTDKYGFPVSEKEIEQFKSVIRKLNEEYDEDEKEVWYEENLKNETLKFIYKLIKPLTNKKIDFIWDIAKDRKEYLNYLEKSKMMPYDFNDMFLHELYINVTKKLKMIHSYDHTEVTLYFADENIRPSYKYELDYIPEEITENHSIVEYLKVFKNKKVKNDLKSTKAIGDQYEKVCQAWLANQGYNDIELKGGKGDKGLDIIAKKPIGTVVGIQCKYKNSGQVTSSEVRLLSREVIQQFYPEVEETIMLSNSSLSKDAIKDLELLQIGFSIVHFDPS